MANDCNCNRNYRRNCLSYLENKNSTVLARSSNSAMGARNYPVLFMETKPEEFTVNAWCLR